MKPKYQPVQKTASGIAPLGQDQFKMPDPADKEIKMEQAFTMSPRMLKAGSKPFTEAQTLAHSTALRFNKSINKVGRPDGAGLFHSGAMSPLGSPETRTGEKFRRTTQSKVKTAAGSSYAEMETEGGNFYSTVGASNSPFDKSSTPGMFSPRMPKCKHALNSI